MSKHSLTILAGSLAAFLATEPAAAQNAAPSPAVATFTDARQTDAKRLAAVRDQRLLEPSQVASVEQILATRTNSTPLRLQAVRLLSNTLFADKKLVASLENIIVDRSEATELRLAALGHLSDMFFPMTHPMTAEANAMAMPMTPSPFFESARKLLDDPDPRLVNAGFTVLARIQDAQALSRLADFLQDKTALPMSKMAAIGLIGFGDPAPYFAAIHQAYRESTDPETRAAALHFLGSYRQANADLVAAALGCEPAPVRLAALTSLYASDREGFAAFAAPILSETSCDSRAEKAFAMNAEWVVRSNPPYRQKKLAGYDDNFDRGVRVLAHDRDPELAALARRYLRDTDPRFVP